MERMPDHIGPFEIRGRLGRGAMAVVWRAYDPSLDREVAIKEPLLPTDDEALRLEYSERFVREARAAARLSHPGIVTIHSVGVYGGRPAIVMELIEGPTLRTTLSRTSLSIPQAFSVLSQLLSAVSRAHEHQVVHRDLKPENAFLTADGRVRLVDFGIAHVEGSTLTRDGAIMGTPAYMSPEQIRGEHVDARADVFAIGAIAFELLAGSNPFGNSSATHYATIIHRIINEPTPPLELDVPNAHHLAGVVMRALKKEPENRFENATAMLSAWQKAYLDPVDPVREIVTLVSDTAGATHSPKTVISEAPECDPEDLPASSEPAIEDRTLLVNTHGGVAEPTIELPGIESNTGPAEVAASTERHSKPETTESRGEFLEAASRTDRPVNASEGRTDFRLPIVMTILVVCAMVIVLFLRFTPILSQTPAVSDDGQGQTDGQEAQPGPELVQVEDVESGEVPPGSNPGEPTVHEQMSEMLVRDGLLHDGVDRFLVYDRANLSGTGIEGDPGVLWLVALETKDPLSVVLDWYKAELQTAGWTVTREDPSLPSVVDFFLPEAKNHQAMAVRRAADSGFVLISEVDGQTQIVMLLNTP